MIYLLIYDGTLGSEEDVKNLLNNNHPMIENWRTDIINSFFIESERSAEEIADWLISVRPRSRFLVTEIADNRQGLLPKFAWDFLREG